MKRLGIMSDVHADVHAVRDALTQMERLGCDVIVCAGDLVDYGLFPEETLTLLRERRIPCVRGNHDRWAVRNDEDGAARDTSGWDLSAASTRFLAALPTKWDATIEGVRIAVRHASPRSDMDGIYPEQVTLEDARRWLEGVNADVMLVGHTHLAFVLSVLGGGVIANPGALLRDAAEKHEAEAMLYDPESGAFVRGPAPGGGTFGVLELPSCAFSVHRAGDGVEVDITRVTVGVQDRRGL